MKYRLIEAGCGLELSLFLAADRIIKERSGYLGFLVCGTIEEETRQFVPNPDGIRLSDESLTERVQAVISGVSGMLVDLLYGGPLIYNTSRNGWQQAFLYVYETDEQGESSPYIYCVTLAKMETQNVWQVHLRIYDRVQALHYRATVSSKDVVRIIRSDYTPYCFVSNGGKLRIQDFGGEPKEYEVNINGDEYHIRVGHNCYHICQFAECVLEKVSLVTAV